MRTDTELTTDVMEALRWESSLIATDIHAVAEHGVVTLTGFVPTYADKWTVQNTVRHVRGVKAIAEGLKVNVSGIPMRADTDIASAALDTLRWHVWIPDTVQVTVQDGWVTLTGTVGAEYQRTSAQHAVRHLKGVVGVSNAITMLPTVQPVDVKKAIEKALKRDVEIEADGVTVQTQGGSVTLSGKIGSWEEHDRAGFAAWNAPGVTAVENNLVVKY